MDEKMGNNYHYHNVLIIPTSVLIIYVRVTSNYYYVEQHKFLIICKLQYLQRGKFVALDFVDSVFYMKHYRNTCCKTIQNKSKIG